VPVSERYIGISPIFANKEAILIEMARAQLESDRIAVTRALSKSISGAPAEPERLAMLQLRDGLSKG
jgi:hypothetical protein